MDTSSGVLGQLARQVGGSWAQPAAGPRLNCLGACACSAALSGRGASVLGPLLAPAEAAFQNAMGRAQHGRERVLALRCFLLLLGSFRGSASLFLARVRLRNSPSQ